MGTSCGFEVTSEYAIKDDEIAYYGCDSDQDLQKLCTPYKPLSVQGVWYRESRQCVEVDNSLGRFFVGLRAAIFCSLLLCAVCAMCAGCVYCCKKRDGSGYSFFSGKAQEMASVNFV